MTPSRRHLASAVLALGLVASAPASADIAFSGTGLFGTLASPGETWQWGTPPSWSSPGVGAGLAIYGGTEDAIGFRIAFQAENGTTPTIDPASIATGNTSACAGGSLGGTTFCGQPLGTPWVATLINDLTIEFLAPASDPLSLGGSYFVNIFFTGDDAPIAFTGAWLTEVVTPPPGVPEPGTVALLAAALAGAGFVGRRRAN
ncbi:MAG: PEP-CTERM sorting domain-containing protein [Rhodocyclaceae bacterium]|nr:PEP-CTERM sorting domain-containing protein [Rhodocyclaceae bacterium]